MNGPALALIINRHHRVPLMQSFIEYRDHTLTIVLPPNGGVAIDITTEYDGRPVGTQTFSTLAGAIEAAKRYVDSKFRALH